MTTVREIVETPGMPGWVRVAIGLIGLAFCRMAAVLAEPLIESGWMWGQGLAAAISLGIGLDVLHAAARKRWPLVLFLDLLVVRGVTGKWR